MSKTNQILLVVLAALAGLWVFLEKPWAKDSFERSAEQRARALFESFDAARAEKIIIKQGSAEVVIHKTASGWTLPAISEFKASEDRVARMLERVRSMNRADLVTTDKSQHTRYRVAEPEAPRVGIYDASGRALAEFVQGKPYFNPDELQGGGRLSALDVYIRPVDSDEVYRISPFESIEPVQASDWLPRSLYKFDVGAVQTLTISGSDVAEQIALNHLPDGSWSIATQSGDQPASREACETLVRSLSSMYMSDVVGGYNPAEATKFGFDRPRIHARATLTGNATEELIVGSDAGEEHAFAIGGIAKQHVAKIYKSSLAALKATKAQLAAPAASQPAASQPATTQPGGAASSK
jgi:hypothetical protein